MWAKAAGPGVGIVAMLVCFRLIGTPPIMETPGGLLAGLLVWTAIGRWFPRRERGRR